MRVRILGPVEAEDDSGHTVELGSPKQQALLALLTIHLNETLSTDRIIHALWGDHPPSDGPGNVQVYVSRLREILEPGRAKRAPGRLIVTEASGYALRIDPEDIDAVRFERLVTEARAEMVTDLVSARRRIQEALDMWRGRPLAGLENEEFAQSEIRRLEEVHIVALELMYEASIGIGECSAVIPDLEKLIAQNPLRERLVGLLMEALAGSGRQAEALRTYRSLELLLGSEVGLEPSVELRRLEERILLQQDSPSEKPLSADTEIRTRGNIPARLTSFVGRDDDLDRIVGLIGTARLITLTGPGGVGKTSLAIEAARYVAHRYEGRVWLVDLSPLNDAADVIAAVGDALDVKEEPGVSTQRAIADAVGFEECLILLDNCEHVVDAVSSLVVQLLREAPELTVVCTSRRSVAVEGESVYEVPPLGVPPSGASVDELRTSASSQLFSERAVAVSPGFDLVAENADDIAALCVGLDGIPLAIELAASTLRSMTINEVVESLEDRMSLGGRARGAQRHRTLRDTMQWSYDLIDTSEQELFDRLSVFVGRFSRQAALAVGAGPHDTSLSVALAGLVDASMLVADVSGQATSHRMLPTLRDFGVFNLRDRGELESVRAAHAQYLATDAADMSLPLVPFGSITRIERNASVDDFRAAANWALRAGLTDLAMALLVPIGHLSVSGGRPNEAALWLDRVKELDLDGSLDMWRLRVVAALADWYGGRNDDAEVAFRSLCASAVQMGETDAASDALQWAGYIRWRLGDLVGARRDMAKASEDSPDRVGRSHSPRQGLAVLELHLGNVSAAERQADLLDAFAARTNDPIAMSNALNVRGWVARYRGELDESICCFQQCHMIAVEEGDLSTDVNARLGIGWVHEALGQSDQALTQAEFVCHMSGDAGLHAKRGEALILMGGACADLGDLPEAARSLREGLRVLRSGGGAVNIVARGLDLAGGIAAGFDRSDLAVRFVAAANAELQRIQCVDPPADAARSAGVMAAVRGKVGDDTWADLTASARDVSFDDVVSEAIDYLDQSGRDTV